MLASRLLVEGTRLLASVHLCGRVWCVWEVLIRFWLLYASAGGGSPAVGSSFSLRTCFCAVQEKQGNITNQACKDEVFYFELMEVKDFRNDVILGGS